MKVTAANTPLNQYMNNDRNTNDACCTIDKTVGVECLSTIFLLLLSCIRSHKRAVVIPGLLIIYTVNLL